MTHLNYLILVTLINRKSTFAIQTIEPLLGVVLPLKFLCEIEGLIRMVGKWRLMIFINLKRLASLHGYFSLAYL